MQVTTYDLVITDLGRAWSSDRSQVAGADLLTDPVIRQGGTPVLVYAGRRAAQRRAELMDLGAYGVANDREDLYDLVRQVIGSNRPEDGGDGQGLAGPAGRAARS